MSKSSRVQTFRARSMPEALALVKREFGPDAVILGTRHLAGGALGSLLRRAIVEITASPADVRSPAPRLENRNVERSPSAVAGPPPSTDSQDARPRSPSAAARVRETPAPGDRSTSFRQTQPSHSPALPEDLLPYYQHLVQNEVAEALAAQLALEAAESALAAIQNPKSKIQNRDDAFREALSTAIARRIPAAGGIALTPGKTHRAALIGPPGGGKTTTLAKLAAHFALRQQKSVAILSLDMHRPGTHDQMQRYGELIGVPVFTAQSGSAVRDIMKTLPAVDLLLIDTHGVSPRDRGRFARLAALLRAAKPDETHLVLSASLSASAQERMIETFAPLGVSRVAITKLDEAVGLGVVLSALAKLNWGLSYLTDGQRVPTDLHEARGPQIAELLLPSR